MSPTTYGLGLFFILFPCHVKCVAFLQSPSLTVKDGREAEIHCSHDDSNLSVMLWYQQRQASPGQCGAAGPIVLQPRQLLTLPGNTTTSSPVTLQCSLGPGFSMSSYTMMWYRQVRYGGPVEFLIKEYEKTLGRYKEDLDTSGNRFILQISELVVEDSGVYYCVASHSETTA